jgi:glucose/arabinose dehydrogenase
MKINLISLALLMATLTPGANLFAGGKDTTNISTAKKIVSANADADIKLPTGFSASVIAERFGGARHIAVASNGDIYVKLSRLKDGKGIYRLRDKNKDGVIDDQLGFGNYAGTGIYLKNGYLYASSNQNVYRYKLNEKGEVIAPDQPETIVKGLVARGRDESKSIVVDNNHNLYVTVGSYSNACVDEVSKKSPSPCNLLDSIGGVWRFKADQQNQEYSNGTRYATGLKNMVAIDWNKNTNSLFVMQHGRDGLHDANPTYFSAEQDKQLPSETMFELHKGADAGWPYIYYDHIQKKKILAPEYGGDGKKTGGQNAIDPVVAFPAHLAPNGLLFYTGNQFPAKYKNGAFIAFHGFSSEVNNGFLVAFVPFKNGKPSGKWEIFADNFGAGEGQPAKMGIHRPCGLAQGADGSIYVTDDVRGNIYKITYNKTK